MHAFASQAQWLAWLREHHGRTDGLWLKLAKKGTGIPTVSYEQAREGAITYGWIDGLINKYDEQWYLLRFTPRRPRSKWSKINREIAERLIASKRMRKAGRAEVEAARADGRWDAAYDPPSTMKPHRELVAALEASPTAKAAFAGASRTNRHAIMVQVQDAKRDATRAKRIARIVDMLERGEVPYPKR